MAEQQKKSGGVKPLDSDFFQALERCADALTLDELSRVTGVRLELLRRYIDRKVRGVRAETWDKIYPVLKPYLEAPEPPAEPPLRIGAPYRRHAELVEMLSEQKVLLDVFAVFADGEQKKIIRQFSAALGHEAEPTKFSSLNAAENRVMGLYLAMEQPVRDAELSKLTQAATAEVKRRRAELF